ncbi:MAG: PAS domain S-box protein [Methanocella sp.]
MGQYIVKGKNDADKSQAELIDELNALRDFNSRLKEVVRRYEKVADKKDGYRSLYDLETRAESVESLRHELQEKQREVDLQSEEPGVQNEELRAQLDEINARVNEVARMNAALRESEEKFRVLADTSSAVIYVYQGENPVYVNDAAERITGYSKDELLKMKFWDIVHLDFREMIRARGIARQHGEQVPSPYEFKLITKTGETRWAELTAGRIQYMGKPAGVATFFDITERKRAEEDREKALYRLDERVKELNALHSMARIFQKQSTIPELLQEMVSILPPAWQYQDVTTARVTYDGNEYRTKNFIEGGWRQTAEFVTSNGKKGAIEIFYIEVTPPEAEGPFLKEERNLINSLAKMLRIYLDRKQAEEALRESESRFRQLSESLPQLVWTCRADGTCDYVSPQWVDYTGVPGKLQLGHGWLEQVHPDDRERVAGEWALVPARDRPYDIEYRMRRYDGVYRWFKARATPLRDTAGNLVKWFGSNTDIDDLKRAEDELKAAKMQSELYLDLMGHDINNLNHSAMGYLELAMQELETEKRLRLDDKLLIERPMHALANSSALIDNVRKLQRLMSEGIKTKPIDLSKIFRELEATSFHLDDREVLINFQHVPGFMVEANELLKDVFINLITNAVKHSDEEKPLTVNVKVEPFSENGQKYYLCSIEDDGPGIPDEMKPKLFHRFQQGKTMAHGKGLGLYIVRTLVEGYHGRVRVEDRVHSDHTKGAKFVVMLRAV